MFYNSQEFTGSYYSFGGASGNSSAVGGPGTVYIEQRGQNRRLFVSNIPGTPRTVRHFM